MKKYFNTIKISAVLLLLFPFLGLPILLENLYVIILSAIIGITIVFIQEKSGITKQENKEDVLQNYVQELKDKFQEQKQKITPKSDTINTRFSETLNEPENNDDN